MLMSLGISGHYQTTFAQYRWRGRHMFINAPNDYGSFYTEDVNPRHYDRFMSRVEGYKNSHSKTREFSIDLHYPRSVKPEDINGNADISRWRHNYERSLNRRGLDPDVAWTREESKTGRPHYHVHVLVDGQKVRYPYGLYKDAKASWEKVLNTQQDGLAHYCNKDKHGTPHPNGLEIRRNEETPDFIKRKAMYYSKLRSKGEVGDGNRNYYVSSKHIIKE